MQGGGGGSNTTSLGSEKTLLFPPERSVKYKDTPTPYLGNCDSSCCVFRGGGEVWESFSANLSGLAWHTACIKL